MRLLRLTDDESFELDLHPFVTVVQGLDERSRPAVLDAVAALVAGRDPGLRGLLEAHGVLLDLDRSTLAMLELSADVDPVVRAGDIPRSEGPAARAARLATEVRDEAAARLSDARRHAREALEVRAAAQEALDRERSAVAARPVPDERQVAAIRQAVADAEIARRDLEAELVAARIAHAEAWEAREQEQAVLDEARERRRQAAEACARLARALERARADRDPSAEAALEAAAAWLAELERATADDGHGHPGSGWPAERGPRARGVGRPTADEQGRGTPTGGPDRWHRPAGSTDGTGGAVAADGWDRPAGSTDGRGGATVGAGAADGRDGATVGAGSTDGRARATGGAGAADGWDRATGGVGRTADGGPGWPGAAGDAGERAVAGGAAAAGWDDDLRAGGHDDDDGGWGVAVGSGQPAPVVALPTPAPAGIAPDALRGHIERLEQRRAELLDRLGSPGGLADRIRGALADHGAEPTAAESVPEAVALAEEWREVVADLAGLGGERSQDVDAVLAARQRLETARRELVAAEDAVRLPELDREAIEALEVAHGEVLDAEEKVSGRFAGGRAQRRLDAVRAEEQRLLDELGFRTYADYLIGTSILHVDASSEARLDRARSELAAAEDDWAALEATLDSELDRGAVLDRARAVRERAAALLGEDPGDDVEGRLLALRRSPSGGPAARALRRLLEQVGLYVVDDAHLAATARAWLADQATSGEEDRDAARAELAVIEAELADVRHSFDLPAPPPPAAERDARLEEARAALAAAEQRLARHRDAEALVAELSAALEGAAAAERAVTAGIAAAEERVAAAARPEQEAVALVTHLEAELVRAVEDELAAVTALADLEPPAARPGDDHGMAPALERKLMAAMAAEEAAVAAVHRAQAAFAAAQERWAEAEEDAASERSSLRRSGPIEEVEWFLLARLAAQRAVSYAGSVPLVVDDALAALPATARAHLLDRLERMASTVQLIYLGDDVEVAAWAERAGGERAAVVRPVRPAAVRA